MQQLPPDEELEIMDLDPQKRRSLRTVRRPVTVQLTLSNLRRLQERGVEFADPQKASDWLREAHKAIYKRPHQLPERHGQGPGGAQGAHAGSWCGWRRT